MIPRLWLNNLALYSLHAAIVVAVGMLLPRLVRLRLPHVLLAYYQLLLVVCLLLPALAPWKSPPPDGSGAISMETSPATLTNAGRHAPSLAGSLALALLLGLCFRATRLAVALARLRHYLRHSQPVDPLPADLAALCSELGVRPAMLQSRHIVSPVTFGVRRPVVLFPAGLLDLPVALRTTIAAHELLHVRRRDWVFTVAEEVAGSLLWFHPAVWWLLGQIHLAREQTVDREVLRLTQAPREYLDALVTFAGGRLEPDLAPAPPFLSHGHLPQRVSLILKEPSMSRKRLWSSLATVAGVLAFATRLTVITFPLRAPAQAVVARGGANLLHRAPVEYPPEAVEKGIQGTVVVEARLNEHGAVQDARVVSGPEPLRKAALKSVLDWHYDAQQPAPGAVEIAIDFHLPAAVPKPTGPAVMPDAVFNGIAFTGVSAALRETLLAQLSIREGDPLDSERLAQIRQAVRETDEHLAISVRPAAGDAHRLSVRVYYPAPVTTAVADSVAPQRIRVGGNVQALQLLTRVMPVYPPLAKQARLQGTVRFNVIINKDGTVQDAQLVSGEPLLAEAALEAVRQWVYKPTLLNGEPVEVVSVIDVNFTLAR